MLFSDKYNKIKNLVSGELSVVEQKMISSVDFDNVLFDDLKKFIKMPSKRVRSVISILLVRAIGAEISEEQAEMLSVVELVHNASLIHDDVIDEDQIRRGKKTVSAKFGNKMAIVGGDYLLGVAMGKLARLGSIDIITKFTDTIKLMCRGEINQNLSLYKVGTIEEYIEKTKDKTAYLFETAITSCFMLGKEFNYFEKLSEFGLNVGMAFQIRDDILNITDIGSKTHNSDILQGIYNAPVILGYKDDNYQSGIEKTKILLDNYVEKAKNDLDFLPENAYKAAIFEFLELLKDV